jgi:hypothetical protein
MEGIIMTEYYKAIEVADIARELIKKYHSALGSANIVFLFRDKAPKSKGNLTLGAARRTNPVEKTLTGYDFIIWIAEDEWSDLDMKERKALVDHELSHCGLDENGNWTTLEHDFTGFNAVLRRYGYWSGDLKRMKKSIEQMSLFDEEPKLEAVK